MLAHAAPITDPTHKPPRPRRWIPLSLWLFAAILALVGLGNMLQVILPIYRQQMAIRTIERLGGQINSEPAGPKWIRAKLGDKCMSLFDKVTLVNLTTSSATEADLACLNGLRHLDSLYLGKQQMTVAGIRQIRGLTQLRFVSLPHGDLTNWAAGELMRAGMRCETMYGQGYHLHIVPASTKIPRYGVLSRLPESAGFEEFRDERG